MAIIKINVRNVISSGNATVSAQGALSGARSGVNSVKNQLDSRIRSSNNIGGRMSNLTNKISSVENRITRLRNVVEKCANSYQDTDDRLKRKADSVREFKFNNRGSSRKSAKNKAVLKKLDKNHNWFEIGLNRRYESGDKKLRGMSFFDIKSGDDYFRAFGYEYSNELKRFWGKISDKKYLASFGLFGLTGFLGKREKLLEMSSKGEYDGGFFKKWEDALEDKFKNKNYLKKKESKKYYKDGKEIKEEDSDFSEEIGSIDLLNIGGKKSVSIFDGEYKYGKGKVNATVGEAEAHASISGGFSITKDDGTVVFNPGVNAEIGASVTAARGEWEQQWLGNEMLGINSNVKAEVLTAGAGVSAGIGLYDKDGKMNPQLSVNASAEALVGEIEGSVGANVLGGEVGVKGSVNFGIGAHADVGLKDGVIKCDLGLSVGLGFSVGLEVDVGGMVNTVADAASSAWDAVTGWIGKW